MHSGAAQAESWGLSVSINAWTPSPCKPVQLLCWCTHSSHDIWWSLHWEASALRPLCSVSQTTSPSEGRETNYGKLILIVCQISHWHCIHFKMGTVATHTASESNDLEVSPFMLKSEALVDGELGWNLANSAFMLSYGTLICLSSPSLYGSIPPLTQIMLGFYISDLL